MSNWKSCGICCLGFSLFAIAFLLSVGAVLDTKSETIYIEEDKRSNASSNCKIGAAIYAGFVFLSVLCIVLPPYACPPKKQDEESLDDFRAR